VTVKYVNSLPDTIKVGPYYMKVCKVDKIDNDDKYFGMFEGAKETISIVLNHPSKTRAADTLLHELIHAVWYIVAATGEEEQTTSSLSTGLIQALVHDNPELLKWLAKARP
jgi:hypothetical protein